MLSVRAQQTTMVFDLGGVMLEKSIGRYVQEFDILALLFQTIRDQTKPWMMQALIFDLLKTMDRELEVEFTKEDGFRNACTTKGVEFPYIISLYQSGRIGPKEALTRAKKAINANYGFFKSIDHQKIVERAVELIFNPECDAKCSLEIAAGMKLLEELAAIRDSGTGVIKEIVGLSNWEEHSFELTRRRVPGLKNFDDIIISGKTGKIKPNKQAFTDLLERHRLEASDCLFVDDQMENIEAARACGIKSLLFTDYYKLRKELYDLGILPTEPSNPRIRQKALLALSVVVGILLIVIECARRRAA